MRLSVRCLSVRLLLLAPLGACAAPQAALHLSPVGHGHPSGRPGPQPVAWRANELAAPCALECKDGGAGGLACSCAPHDTIYLDHLERAAQARAQADGSGR